MAGDIIYLTEGMVFPADGILLDSSELTVDESAMTGETNPVRKEIFEEVTVIILSPGGFSLAGFFLVPS